MFTRQRPEHHEYESIDKFFRIRISKEQAVRALKGMKNG